MRISTRGRYSLEAMLFLALENGGEYVSVRAISENTGATEGYLEQLIIPLKKAGLVRGLRGSHGGYVCGKPTDQILVGDILRAVEGSLAPVACLDECTCPGEAACITRHTWGNLYAEITDCIDSMTLADLVSAYYLMDEQEYLL